MKVSAIVLAGMQALANSQANAQPNAQHGYFKASKPSNALSGNDFGGSDHLLDDDNSTSTAIVGPIQPPRHLDLVEPAADQSADGFVAMSYGCNDCYVGPLYGVNYGTVILPNDNLGFYVGGSSSNYWEIDFTTLQATGYGISSEDNLIAISPKVAVEQGTFFTSNWLGLTTLSEVTINFMFRPADGSSLIAKAFNFVNTTPAIMVKLTEQSVACLAGDQLFNLNTNLAVSDNYKLTIADVGRHTASFVDMVKTNVDRLVLSGILSNDSFYSLSVLNGQIKWANEYQMMSSGSFCFSTTVPYRERGALFLHSNSTDSSCSYYSFSNLWSVITWVNPFGHVLKSVSVDIGEWPIYSSICATDEGGVFLVSYGYGFGYGEFGYGYGTSVTYLEEFSHKWTTLLNVVGSVEIKECGNFQANNVDLMVQFTRIGTGSSSPRVYMGVAGFSKYGFEPTCSDPIEVLQKNATVVDVTDKIRSIDKSHLFSIAPSNGLESAGDLDVSITENDNIQFEEKCVSAGSVIDSANQLDNQSGSLFPAPGDFPAPSPHVPSPIGPTTTASAWEQFTTLITEMFEETGDDGTTTSSSNAAFGGFPGPDYTLGMPGPSGDDVVFPSPGNNLTSLSPDGEYVPAPNGDAPSPGPVPSANDQLMVIVVCCTILGVVLLAVIGIVCGIRHCRNKAKFVTKDASVTLEGGEAVRQLRSTAMHVQSDNSSIQLVPSGTNEHGVAQSQPVVAVPNAVVVPPHQLGHTASSSLPLSDQFQPSYGHTSARAVRLQERSLYTSRESAAQSIAAHEEVPPYNPEWVAAQQQQGQDT